MHDPIKINVVRQGAPVVNDGLILRRGENIIAIVIDMKSKRCDVDSFNTSFPGFVIRAVDESLHLDETKPVDAYTIIELPDFAGWEVWMCEISRYTLSACLIREATPS